MSTKRNKLIYIFDALCPWCYAFTPVVKSLYDKYSNHFEFEVLSGGLVVGEQVKTLGGQEESEKLRKGYQKVAKKTEIQFGEKFFERVAKEYIILNSEVPATVLPFLGLAILLFLISNLFINFFMFFSLRVKIRMINVFIKIWLHTFN